VKEAVNEIKGKLYYPKYPVINEAHSYAGAFRVARLGDIVARPERCLLSEGIDWDVEQEEKGGIIVFSTDVNAVRLSSNKLINFMRQKVETMKNRMGVTRKIDKIANDNELVGWTIGHYLDGRYQAKNGQNFGENSLSIELIGIDEDKLIRIAEEICRAFMQEGVLVKSYSTGRILFVNPD
jgi:hypothetical protein